MKISFFHQIASDIDVLVLAAISSSSSVFLVLLNGIKCLLVSCLLAAQVPVQSDIVAACTDGPQT